MVINPLLTASNQAEGFDNIEGIATLGLNRPGGFAKYMNVPQTVVHKVPESLPLKYVALVEPQAVAMQAIKESGMRFGDTVAIIGQDLSALLQYLGRKLQGLSI